MHADDDARRRAWSAYWATGGLHSCVGSFDAGYSGAIGAFWAQQFAALQPHDRVLDLATGNGALPRMLWTRLGAGCPDIEAVDLAQVAPDWHDAAAQERIRFHSGVAMEQLPFPDGHFTLVVSQYGFEYARREAALDECLRVLAPGGRLAFVMHHAGSVLVRVGRGELACQARLLRSGGLLDAAAAVLGWFARARAGEDLRANAEANAARSAYNAATVQLASDIAQLDTPDLAVEARDHVHRIVSSTGANPEPALAALAAYREAIAAAGLRSAEMISHALDDTQAQALLAQLAQRCPGASVACRPLAQAQGLLGWALTLAPAGSGDG